MRNRACWRILGDGFILQWTDIVLPIYIHNTVLLLGTKKYPSSQSKSNCFFQLSGKGDVRERFEVYRFSKALEIDNKKIQDYRSPDPE